ncbi:MAG: preprotein translocase subunit SecE [Succinivibrionaceae bacterium]|nr:preprotein translocase subunit SecE [Succinivibrionaceae bacterium]
MVSKTKAEAAPQEGEAVAKATGQGAAPAARKQAAKKTAAKAGTAKKAAPRKAAAKKADTAEAAKKPVARKGEGKEEAQPVGRALDTLLWVLAFALVGAAVFGNYYYTNNVVVDESVTGRLLRVGAVIATIAAGLAVTLFTNKGRTLLKFTRESYVELRKVVWPTRQEAVQTTFIVFIAVCVVSLFLYLCDVVFLQVVKAITL